MSTSVPLGSSSRTGGESSATPCLARLSSLTSSDSSWQNRQAPKDFAAPGTQYREGSVKFVPLAAAAMAGILLAAPADAQTRRYAGRPVADVLKALESPELALHLHRR